MRKDTDVINNYFLLDTALRVGRFSIIYRAGRDKAESTVQNQIISVLKY